MSEEAANVGIACPANSLEYWKWRAEAAEKVIRGMFPLWINAMGYCEHGKKDQLVAMQNYYNGRDNPMTNEDIHLMFSLIPDKGGK